MATLEYGRRDDRLAVFPFPHTLTLELELTGDALTVTTTVEATGEDDVPLAFGWHPWLSLPGVAARGVGALDARVRGAPARRARPADGRADARAPADASPLGDRVLDDHFKVAEDARFAIAGGGREIAVEWAGGYTPRAGLRARRRSTSSASSR